MDYGSYPQHWLLFDRLVQQVVLQTSQSSQNSSESGVSIDDNDPIAPLDNLNVKEIVHQLGKESEISDLRVRAEELEKENIELATNLSKKEQVKEKLGKAFSRSSYACPFYLMDFGLFLARLFYFYLFPLLVKRPVKRK